MTAKDKGEASGAEQRLIRELAEILDDTGLSEIEFEKSGLKIRVARELSAQPIAAVPLAAPAAAAPPAAA
ncbi:MAG: acetyl-CoA carboxylase, biotin carboxyl carrier protein, partial [Hyphomicrobiaceae bacterium]|nr:acetyl-CoA carboxylase, biotin carboxyl carrier protein [Hyphomicrobiaceae bacterium]